MGEYEPSCIFALFVACEARLICTYPKFLGIIEKAMGGSVVVVESDVEIACYDSIFMYALI